MQSRVAGVFLQFISGIYIVAFLSLYCQIPGLYGRNGILPIHRLVPISESPSEQFFTKTPTLLWFMPSLGLDPEHGMELLCLLGCALGGLTLLWEKVRSSTSYFILWLLYLSMYQVGQTFLWFQWDILLLETGFLALFVAPTFGGKPAGYNIGLWLVQWLLFRLMFASGVVKLTSHCPTWWGLTALDYHFESQCIPTPLAWHFHHLPEWFRRLGVVGTYVIEIAAPFFFFMPVRSLRLLGFWLQVLFQLNIIVTGNYNFFNALTCVLCLSLLDDRALSSVFSSSGESSAPRPYPLRAVSAVVGQKAGAFLNKAVSRIALFSVTALVLYWTGVYFDINFNTGNAFVETKVAFSKAEFASALEYAMPLTVWMAVLSLGIKLLQGVIHCLEQRSFFSVLLSAFNLLCVGSAAVYLFAISLMSHTALDQGLQSRLWPVVHQWHSQSSYYHLTSSYGLFRRMTGVGGRPEVVLEGSNDLKSGWQEYHFLYKPGNLSTRPPVVAPHQPRLDWQMWFAALGSYQHNPWLISLVERLLVGEKTVLDLLDHSPFPTSPPKYIRGKLYHYSFTAPGAGGDAWWKREEVSEYFPPLTKGEKSVHAFLSHHHLLDRDYPHRSEPGFLRSALLFLRQLCTGVPAPTLIVTVLAVLVLTRVPVSFFA